VAVSFTRPDQRSAWDGERRTSRRRPPRSSITRFWDIMKLTYRSILFLLIVVVPFGLFATYEFGIASDRYHSASAVSLTEENKVAPVLDLSAIGLQGSVSTTDALTLVTFMNSPDMADYLDQKLKLREHYSQKNIDWWTRLPEDASKEDLHDYLAGMITVELNSLSQLIQIHVQAFDRQFAQNIVTALLERSQRFVDVLNAKMTEEKISFFESQLASADKRLQDAKTELLEFQRNNQLLDAEAEAARVSSSISALNSQLIAKQGQLAVSLQELKENSPVVRRIKAEIDTLIKQIAEEKDRLSIGSKSSPVSAIYARFAEIEAKVGFLDSMYKSNLVQLEAAKVEAVKRLKYLIVVTQPSLADSSLYPDREYNVVTALVILLMIYFVVSLMIAVVREHA
jgi:capsular polysaccharide transport system permease protein